MAKKKKDKAKRRGDSFQRRMASMLARHGLTIDQAGRLSDADLRRRKGIGRTMIAVIRAAAGPAPPPTRDAAVTERGARDNRIAVWIQLVARERSAEAEGVRTTLPRERVFHAPQWRMPVLATRAGGR